MTQVAMTAVTMTEATMRPTMQKAAQGGFLHQLASPRGFVPLHSPEGSDPGCSFWGLTPPALARANRSSNDPSSNDRSNNDRSNNAPHNTKSRSRRLFASTGVPKGIRTPALTRGVGPRLFLLGPDPACVGPREPK